MKRREALAVLASLPLVARRARAGEVPPDRQGMLILRALAYDRNFKSRAGAVAGILVVFRPGDQPSESMKTDMVGAFEELAKTVTVLDRPVKVSSRGFSTGAGLDAVIRGAEASTVYVCGGLDDAIPAISEVTRRRSALSIASSDIYLSSGLSVAVLARGTKPTIALNLAASRAEGCEWDPLFLRLAEIIK
jgi:hypothetical protein